MADSYTVQRTLHRMNAYLDNPLYLLERLNDSRATVFLFLREAGQPIHVSQIIKRTKVSRAQAYRALQFLKSFGLIEEIHGYWYEKFTRNL